MSSTLIDSSVWISHFKKSDAKLVNLLKNGNVLVHEFVLHEVFLGLPKNHFKYFSFRKKWPSFQACVNCFDIEKLSVGLVSPDFQC